MSRHPIVRCELCHRIVKNPHKGAKHHFCSDCWLHRRGDIYRIQKGLPVPKPLKALVPKRLQAKPSCPVCKFPVRTAFVKARDHAGKMRVMSIGRFCQRCNTLVGGATV